MKYSCMALLGVGLIALVGCQKMEEGASVVQGK